MNEEDLLKQIQDYFQQYSPVNRTTPQGTPAYDPNQARMWSDTQPSYRGLQDIGSYIDSKQKQAPNIQQEHNANTLMRLLQMQQKKYQM